jgi:sterol desaturase/sphingolipid hydroxylase (fatty acid hydroxylase superfamily)
MIQTASWLLPKLPIFLMIAVATHLVMSLVQTLMHYKLGHHPIGGKFFRNHINFHHSYYSKDHLVSRTYLGDKGNNTPFFFIPVFLVGACTYLLLPVDLFVVQVVACSTSFYSHVFFDKEYHVEESRLHRFAWFRRKQELHFVHHRHANSNFAVIHFFWDRILGTYRRPDAGQTQTNGTLRIGGPDGCSAIRNGRLCLSSPIALRHGSSHPRAYRLRDHDRCHLSDTVRTNHQTASPRPLQSVRRCDCE